MAQLQKVSTCLWFDKDGEAAANYYVSLIPGSSIISVSRYGDGAPMPKGTAMLVRFSLAGVEFGALNGGPLFPQSEAVSLVVTCEDQAEIDRLWTALIADGGKESRCGWLKDRWGVSWQIVPAQVAKWMDSGDGPAIGRMFGVLMGMNKLDIATLQAAFEGRG